MLFLNANEFHLLSLQGREGPREFCCHQEPLKGIMTNLDFYHDAQQWNMSVCQSIQILFEYAWIIIINHAYTFFQSITILLVIFPKRYTQRIELVPVLWCVKAYKFWRPNSQYRIHIYSQKNRLLLVYFTDKEAEALYS